MDVEDRELMRSRPWRWLQVRIVGLLSIESRLQRALASAQESSPDPG